MCGSRGTSARLVIPRPGTKCGAAAASGFAWFSPRYSQKPRRPCAGGSGPHSPMLGASRGCDFTQRRREPARRGITCFIGRRVRGTAVGLGEDDRVTVADLDGTGRGTPEPTPLAAQQADVLRWIMSPRSVVIPQSQARRAIALPPRLVGETSRATVTDTAGIAGQQIGAATLVPPGHVRGRRSASLPLCGQHRRRMLVVRPRPSRPSRKGAGAWQPK
jgi:hypothetical protein